MWHRLYHRFLDLSRSRYAVWWLAAVAFAEASFFPLPPDALLIPMAALRPQRAWFFAAVCTLGSVIGGCLGYYIGAALFDAVARPVLHFYHADGALGSFQGWYAKYGVAVILVKGLTPIPYKLVTIASGAAHFNFWVFIAASLVTRGSRFFLEAGLLRTYGAELRAFVTRRPWLVTGGAVGFTAAVFAALRFV
jgi:membrane protein YqaA with SNARE-associated domain